MDDIQDVEEQALPNFSRPAKRRRILPLKWILDYWWKEVVTETTG